MTDELWVVFAPADDSSLSLAGKAVQLAGEKGLRPCAVIIGREPEKLTSQMFAHGIRKAYLMQADTDDINCEQSCCNRLASLIKSESPQAILFECSVFNANLAPSTAAVTKLGITADCTSLEWSDEYGLLQIRPAFGGRKMAVNCSVGAPYIATVRKGVFAAAAPGGSTGGEIVYVGIDTPPKPHFCLLDIVESQDDEPGLSGADIILSGGLGLGSRENFDKLHTLAHLTNASVGASRAAVAAGYASYMHQVGQTGVSVSPRVYVAFGISGAVQHLSGIIGAEKIVAVNTDPKAPIHGYSDYSVIADCGDVLDSLIRLFTEKQAEPGQLPYCRKESERKTL